ncbi:MAG: LysR family transcriptional regulator [Pseudomonadota bacterium]
MTSIADFEIFARVARTGNMSAAGREMKFSPAVVSKRISLLEEQLGTRLFQRTTRQLTLTETGEGFYDRVVKILALVDQAEDYVSQRNTSAKGTIKLGAPSAFARMHIVPHLGAFAEKYPEIAIDLTVSDAFDDIIGDGFDLAIRIGELKDSSMHTERLAKEHRVLCASPEYLKSHGRPKSLAELAKHNCLLTTTQTHWRLEGPEGPKTVRPRGNLRTNSAEVVRDAVRAGLGIGFCSTWDVGRYLKSGELKVVLPKYGAASGTSMNAVFPSEDFVPARVTALVDFLSDIYGNEKYWAKSD